jgi:hypothetical protein
MSADSAPPCDPLLFASAGDHLAAFRRLYEAGLGTQLLGTLTGILRDGVRLYPEDRFGLQFELACYLLDHSSWEEAVAEIANINALTDSPDYLRRSVLVRLCYRALTSGRFEELRRFLPTLFHLLPTIDVASMITILWMKEHNAPCLDSRKHDDCFRCALEYLRGQEDRVPGCLDTVSYADESTLSSWTVATIMGRRSQYKDPHSLNVPHYAVNSMGNAFSTPDIKIFNIPAGHVRCKDGSISVWGSEGIFVGPPSSQIILPEKLPEETYHYPGTSALIADNFLSNSYCHWMLDVVPRILMLQRHASRPIDRWIVKRADLPYQKESLALLGISSDKVIELEKNSPATFDNLICLSDTGALCCHPCNYANKSLLQLLREKFSHQTPQRSQQTRARLFISREDAFNRTIYGERELGELLTAQFGFHKVILSTLSLQEQIEAFRNAEIVVCCHGAGLTNIAFCEPGTKVVEIFNLMYGNPAYAMVAHELDLDYHYICAAPKGVSISSDVSLQQKHRPDLGNQDYCIGPDTVARLVTFLESALETSATTGHDKSISDQAIAHLEQIIENLPNGTQIYFSEAAPEVLQLYCRAHILKHKSKNMGVSPLQYPRTVPERSDGTSAPEHTSLAQKPSVVIELPQTIVSKYDLKQGELYGDSCAQILAWKTDDRNTITDVEICLLKDLVTEGAQQLLTLPDLKRDGDYVAMYKGITVQQVPAAVPFLIDFITAHAIEVVVEIGTGYGGLTQALLDNTSARIISIDSALKANHLFSSWSQLHYLITDAHSDATVALVKESVGNSKALLLIDGGNKPWEFNLYRQILKPNDYIFVHDFAPSKEDFERVRQEGVWMWHESSETDLDITGLCRLPDFEAIWRKFVWGAYTAI